jgi:hypothetical protein
MDVRVLGSSSELNKNSPGRSSLLWNNRPTDGHRRGRALVNMVMKVVGFQVLTAVMSCNLEDV